MENLTIEDVLVTYWGQTTLLLFGIGFIIKNIIDLKSKKTEINHTIFQQRKLESVNTFFAVYAKSEQMWYAIAIWDILGNKMMAKDIDTYIQPHLHDLQKNIMELNIYFEEDKFEDFSKIYKNTKLINAKLSEMFFYYKEDKTIIQRANEFQFFRDEKFKENELLLKAISKQLRNMFK